VSVPETPDTRSVHDQPPPIPNATRPVWELVIEDMRERDNVGRARYGTPLQVNNGRDALVDAYQEALDLVVYLKQSIEERAAHRRLEKDPLAVLKTRDGLAAFLVLNGLPLPEEVHSLRHELAEARQLAQDFMPSSPITLGALIEQLSWCAAVETVRFDGGETPGPVHSYRGHYKELAIDLEGKEERTVGDLLKELRAAVGKTFQGWKGGDHLMSETTPVWAANTGESGDRYIVAARRRDDSVVLLTRTEGGGDQ
jgi:hypothetical protein